MLKASELRLGNWVLNHQNKPEKLKGDDLSWILRGVYEFKGVPLTEEELFKFELEESAELGYYIIADNISINIDLDIYFKDDFLLHVDYVHELQNFVLDLTKKELQITKQE